MAQYQTPDLYFQRDSEAQVAARGPLSRAPIHATAFLGFATRGPVGRPLRLTSWSSFEALYGGFSADYLLPQSVFSFFANGGREAVVIRCGETEGEDAASCAALTLRDLYGRPTLRIEAKDPGGWGRLIKARIQGGSRPPRTRVLGALSRGAHEAQVKLTKGLEPGAVVRISDGARSEYVTLSEVGRKKISWSKKEALRASYEEPNVEGVELQLTVVSPFGFEIHDNLVFGLGHSRSFEEIVNARSSVVTVRSLGSRTPAPFDLPQAELEQALVGGSDGASGAGAADFLGTSTGLGERTGLQALEDFDDVGLICAPDLQTAFERGSMTLNEFEATQRAIVDFCERRRFHVALLDVPRGFDVDEARDWRDRFDSKYAALYYPWFKVQDPTGVSGATRLVPPSAHIAGLTAKTDLEVGVHRAAANLVLKDVLGLERKLGKDYIDLLAPEGINCSRSFRGRGIRPWGCRTLSSDTAWAHLNVRRLFIMVQRTIAEGCEWAVFEPNEWNTWKAVERQINSFLYDLWREGALQGDVPEDAFFVRCDEALNPPETREVGELHCEIGLAAVRPAEFIVFRIGQQAKDIITEEPVS
ncbi:MAG: phage tail sheath family protein [Planctomycetes bacterium]|nr:phage tail sheath family protein [Planctomycetota bacterium]